MFKKFKGHYSKRKTHKTDRDVMSYEDMPLDDYEQEKTEMSPQAVKKIVLGACIAIAAGLIVFAFATRGCNRQTGRPYPGKHQSADRLYESRSAGNDADGPRNVYSGIGAELFQVISRTANLHLQLQRHRTEGRWAGISAQ